jgi:protocatechuate 3,4-dioxygenase beta subunit
VLTREGEGFAGLDLVAESELSPAGNCAATSDEDGAFRFEVAGGVYTIWALSLGHEVALVEHVQAGTMDLELTLVESARVRGTVTDPDGRPIESFLVVVTEEEFGTVVTHKAFHHSIDGAFEVGGLPEGVLAVVARTEGFAPSSSGRFRTECDSTTHGVVVRMTEGGSFTGQVLDADSGSPISGAEVFPLEQSRFSVGTGAGSERVRVSQWQVPPLLTRKVSHTDSSGRFLLGHMATGPHRLRIQAEGFAAAVTEEASLEQGKTTELRPQALVRGATITGVVCRDGRIEPGAQVQLAPIDPDRCHDNRTARADDSGRFTFECVSPSSYRLSATRANPGSDPFAAIGDIRRSEIEIEVDDHSRQELELDMGAERR